MMSELVAGRLLVAVLERRQVGHFRRVHVVRVAALAVARAPKTLVLLDFGSPVLEPNFHLGLCQLQFIG